MSIMQDYNHKRVDEALGLLVSIKNVVSQEITSFMSHLRKIGPPLITFPNKYTKRASYEPTPGFIEKYNKLSKRLRELFFDLNKEFGTTLELHHKEASLWTPNFRRIEQIQNGLSSGEGVLQGLIEIDQSDNIFILQQLLRNIEGDKFIRILDKKFEFNLVSGEVKFKGKTHVFQPRSKEFLLLKVLSKDSFETLSYPEIINNIYSEQEKNQIKESELSARIRFLVRNIRQTLLVKSSSGLFKPNRGYSLF